MPSDTATTTPPAFTHDPDIDRVHTLGELTENERAMLVAILELMRAIGGPPAHLNISAHEVPFEAFTDLPASVRGDGENMRWLSGTITCGTERFSIYSPNLPRPALIGPDADDDEPVL